MLKFNKAASKLCADIVYAFLASILSKQSH